MQKTVDIVISLDGNFRLELGGQTVPVSGSRGRALLAVLATSPGQRRSRDRLKAMLWPRRGEVQAASSLRTALTALRRDLGAQAPLLGADRSYVWLDGEVRLVRAGVGHDFFEDAPTTIGSDFEFWLQRERNRTLPVVCAGSALRPAGPERVCIGFLPARLRVDDPHVGLLATRVLDLILGALQSHGTFDLLDLRDLDTDHFAPGTPKKSEPTMMVEVLLAKAGTMAQLSVRISETLTRRMLWTNSLAADQAGPFLTSPNEIVEFANHAVDAIFLAVLRAQEGGISRGLDPPRSMIGVLHQLFSMSREGQGSVRAYLAAQEMIPGSALANACYAMSIANSLGEGGDLLIDLEQARYHAAHAVSLDPQNALVLALCGHVFSFALREFEIGCDMTAMARKLAPTMAFAWDFSAMNAIYRGRFDEAAEFGRTAVRLSQFSPYRALLQSSLAIGATLSGDHAQAVRIGRTVMARMPHFLAVMRHNAVSLAALGRRAEAQVLIERIRGRDPSFHADGIRDPAYPLPSDVSRELIAEAFRVSGVGGR